MRQKMLLLLAVIFGLLAFMLTYKQLEYEKAKIRGTSEERILIQVKTNMVEGQEIKLADIAPHKVRRERDSFNRSREIPWEERSRVIGRRLEVTVIPGQLLQYSDLKPVTLRNGFSAIIKDQCRAVSIPVDPVSSVQLITKVYSYYWLYLPARATCSPLLIFKSKLMEMLSISLPLKLPR